MAGDGSKKNNELMKDSGTSMTFQCPVLNSTNYTIWAVKIKVIFNVHGIWEAVEPTEGAEVDEKKNNMAIAMLYQAIPENMVLQIASLTSAKDIWESLKVRHVGIERVKEARVQTIESDFESLKMGANEPLDIYVGKISEIVSQASSLGHTLDEKRQIQKLLSSVPERFIQIVAAIEQFADLNKMTFQEAVGRLKAFEERTKKQTNEEDTSSKLLYMKEDAKAKGKHHKCEHCGCGNSNQKDFGRGQGRGRGSGRSQGDGRAQRDKSNVKCFKCNELGHFSNECPKWKNERLEANLIQYEDDEPMLLYSSYKDEDENLI